MRFGICTSVSNAPAAKAAGWDFVEENVQGVFQGTLADAEYAQMPRLRQSVLPVAAANCLVPGSIKITGPDASLDTLRSYMDAVLKRAGEAGTRMLVFGSGGARQVPDGFDRERARQQIIDFARMSAPIAAAHGVTLVAEHLNRRECNIINSVAEAMEYVKAVDHPNFQCLVDSYHLWMEDEALDHVKDALAWIRHVHLADKDGRVAPGESKTANYRPLFGLLKRAGYRGLLSVEASGFDVVQTGERVLQYLKNEWEEA